MDKRDVVIVVVPFPAQGHLNQLLHFSRLISTYGFPVYYVGSATHNRQAKQRIQGWDPLSISNIHFQDFPLYLLPTPPPNPNAVNKFPSHLQSTFEASLNLHDPLSTFLTSLSPTVRKLIVIHDSLMPFAAKEAASLPNAEAYILHSTSAFTLLFFAWEALGCPTGMVIPNDVPYLSTDGCCTQEFMDYMARLSEFQGFDNGQLYNTCREMESEFIDLLGQEQFRGNTNRWAIGPLNPVESLTTSEDTNLRHKCLKWLDKQPPRSVLYVSFGTNTSISDEQIVEIANGLEKSKQRFIWVLREADRGDIYAEEGEIRKLRLPKGLEERIERVGVLEREWAPQLEILSHPSTGGFVSHCGWNSCIESMSMGVPIGAWPMHSDQPRNAVLVTEVLRVGIVVREWEKREELVSSDVIQEVVKTLMASEEGEEMRKRAEELGFAVRRSVSEVGTSRADLDSFVAHISR